MSPGDLAAAPGLSDALRELRQIEQEQAAGRSIPFLEWALSVPEPKSGDLSFDRYPFQRELYAEAADDRELVVMKGTQVGVSTWGLRWTLYHADTKGWTGLYVFPTKGDMWDFSAERVKPAIDGSEYLLSRINPEDAQNKGLKRIGLGFVYFRGSESKRGLDSVAADHILFDEYDTLVQENIPDAERRVSGSESGLLRRVGVPSVPAFGISRAFEDSDQRRWTVKCGACGEWQSLDFFQNVDQATATVVCGKCVKPLDVSRGEWVAAHPSRDVRGYHVHRLMWPRANIGAIIAASKKASAYEKQVFFNKDLGIAYAPKDGRLSADALEAAVSAGGGLTMQPGYVGDNLVTMGVDVATTRPLTVRVTEHVGEKRKALWIGGVDAQTVDGLLDELGSLMNRYGVHMAAIDHLPEGRMARTFAARFPGRVVVVAYDTSPRSKSEQVLRFSDETMRHVTVKRTEALDAMMSVMRSQRNLLPLDAPDEYREEMMAPVRVVNRDAETGTPLVSYRSTGPDDYAHAEVYDLVASEVWTMRQAVSSAGEGEIADAADVYGHDPANLDDPDAPAVYDPGGGGGYDDDYDPGPSFE